MQDNANYHGIIVNLSQRDKQIYSQLEILSIHTIIL